ncbi:MotA/TolQ/ExbB proton channel family protein [Bdellovibrionota bacterium FG-1]
MLSHLFLGISLVGAEWVLYLLVLLSLLSVTLIIERVRFYRTASRELEGFRQQLRVQATEGNWAAAAKTADARLKQMGGTPDLETQMAHALLSHPPKSTPDILTEVAQDPVLRARLEWDRNLAVLATIGSNAPFIGLFGTVLGIIKAFHDLSRQVAQGASTVTAGISEALVATAVGLLVAIPAVVAFNLFQRRVKVALAEAEALKSFLIGKLSK